MSLNWDITKCSFTQEWKKENWNSIESMIFLTMVIDMGEITKTNLDEVEYRLRLYSRVTQDSYERIISILPNLVGLVTNVSTTTRKAYEKRVMQMLSYDVVREMKLSKAEVSKV